MIHILDSHKTEVFLKTIKKNNPSVKVKLNFNPLNRLVGFYEIDDTALDAPLRIEVLREFFGVKNEMQCE